MEIKKDFDNVNSLRMRKQEDISLCYMTKQGNLEPLHKLFWSASLNLSNFGAFV